MKQMPFEWREPGAIEEWNKVVLDVTATAAAIALMANALIVVLRGEEQPTEAADDR